MDSNFRTLPIPPASIIRVRAAVVLRVARLSFSNRRQRSLTLFSKETACVAEIPSRVRDAAHPPVCHLQECCHGLDEYDLPAHRAKLICRSRMGLTNK